MDILSNAYVALVLDGLRRDELRRARNMIRSDEMREKRNKKFSIRRTSEKVTLTITLRMGTGSKRDLNRMLKKCDKQFRDYMRLWDTEEHGSIRVDLRSKGALVRMEATFQ